MTCPDVVMAASILPVAKFALSSCVFWSLTPVSRLNTASSPVPQPGEKYFSPTPVASGRTRPLAKSTE
ncbi:hypothetical protein OG738_29320 [Amycolatopsis sp. NBC_01488]|uniref:hypothetical protein n=1 Tax=Amycolatopsis sp. NBC_01488 TaxID=2903563 RepID=UPI002E2D4F59|nr:hypothetical protein [Amycolatopsis sp. NBC_01488]